MKILYLNVIERNAGWGAEWFISRALQELGHFPYSIDFRQNRYSLVPALLKSPECDVLFVQKGDGLALSLIKSIQRPRFYWACDLLGVLPDQRLDEMDAAYDRTQFQLLSSGLFDHLFLRTDNCIDTVVSRGWARRDRCSILSSGFDPEFQYRLPGEPKEFDILFIGSLTPRRRQIIEAISHQYRVKVASAFGPEMVKLINRTKIVLNIHSGPLPDTETRVYEVLGCGAFLLTEQLSPDQPFSHLDLIQFASVDDLKAKLSYYLAHESEREIIAAHGYQTALCAHTYYHRAQQIIATMARYPISSDDAMKPMMKKDRDLWVHFFQAQIQRFQLQGKRRVKSLVQGMR